MRSKIPVLSRGVNKSREGSMISPQVGKERKVSENAEKSIVLESSQVFLSHKAMLQLVMNSFFPS